MEQRKNPKLDLDSKRSLFMSMGLCVSLALVLLAFEWRSEFDPIDIPDEPDEGIIEIILESPRTRIPAPPKPPKPVVINPTSEETQDDNHEEELFDEEELSTEPVDSGFFEVTLVELPEEIIDEPLIRSEVMPSPDGGMATFYKHLSKELRYPRSATRMGIEGRVFIQFVVEKDGSLSDVVAVKGISEECDLEAIRVIKSYPKWNPGKQRGKPVRVRMILPIYFKLNP